MVTHIVCFKLKDGESALKAKEVLLSMQGKVPTAKSISVNIDELKSARRFDILLEVLLDSFSALTEYQADPYHCEVVKTHMHAVAEKSIAIDFTV